MHIQTYTADITTTTKQQQQQQQCPISASSMSHSFSFTVPTLLVLQKSTNLSRTLAYFPGIFKRWQGHRSTVTL